MSKRTWSPKKNKRLKKHGFLSRMSTYKGRLVLQRRRTKGRRLLAAAKAS